MERVKARRLTVYKGSTKDYEPIPRISLQGQWLELSARKTGSGCRESLTGGRLSCRGITALTIISSMVLSTVPPVGNPCR